MPYDEFDDILDGIDEAQLLRDIGEDELARQADMFEQLQKQEAVVEGGQLVRGAQPAPGTPHPSHTATPHTHPGTPLRKHSGSTLADPGPLGKFFEPGAAEAGLAAVAAGQGPEVEKEQEHDSQGSQDEEPFDCAAEVSCPDGTS